MRKATLASLATLLLTTTGASADPWDTYRTAPAGNPAAAMSATTNRFPAYPTIQQQIGMQQVAPVQAPTSTAFEPIVRESFATVESTREVAVQSDAVEAGVVQTSGYASERYSEATPQAYSPAAHPVSSVGSYGPSQACGTTGPAVGLNPGYFGGSCEPGLCVGSGYSAVSGYSPVSGHSGYAAGVGSDCNTCGTGGRGFTVGIVSEALFLNRDNDFDMSRNFVDGPGDSGFGYNDLFDDEYSAGWRLGANVLFGDPCSDWQHGVGVTYSNLIDASSSASGTLDFGLSFDGGTKGTDPSTIADCYVISQNTFFASLARVASINTATNNEQEEFEGLGPDPSTVAFDPGRTTGSEAFALPTWAAGYSSEIDTIGVNMLINRSRGRRLQFGVGWQQMNVREGSFVAVRGPLHATDARFFTGTFPSANIELNNGLEHSSFLDTSAQNGSDPGLQYIGAVGAEDGFDAQNSGTLGLSDGVGPDTVELLSTQQTDNSLNGLNFFVNSQLICHNRFDLFGRLNAGIYHNSVSATVGERYAELTGNGSAYGRTFNAEKDVVSFVGGAGLDAGYWLNEHLRLYGGYEVMFINGIAVAPEQESGVVGNTFMLKHDGDLFLHGAKAGVEFWY